MPSINFSTVVAGLGISIQSSFNRSNNEGIPYEINVPAGKAGQLTTRTDNTTGTLTMSGGHGITTAAVIDLYWAGGRRYGVTVGTVSTNSVPISSGSGDNLPTNNTLIVACVQLVANVSIDGDNLSILALKQKFTDITVTQNSHVQFKDSGGAVIANVDLIPNEPIVWDIVGGSANPFGGNPIVTASITNGSSVSAATLQILGLVNSTP